MSVVRKYLCDTCGVEMKESTLDMVGEGRIKLFKPFDLFTSSSRGIEFGLNDRKDFCSELHACQWILIHLGWKELARNVGTPSFSHQFPDAFTPDSEPSPGEPLHLGDTVS